MTHNSADTRELILAAGKAEFLQHGFEGASLRRIASLAGVTTGAIYGYFADKKALFRALVEEPARELLDAFQQVQADYDAWPAQAKADAMHQYTRKAMNQLLEYIYDHLDAFKLIISCSAGTSYAHYIDRIVEIEEEYTYRFIDALRSIGWEVPTISQDVMHILCSANFHGMFEVVAHDMPKQEALQHIQILSDFYRAGWSWLLGVTKNS